MSSVHVSTHPLVLHNLAILRDATTEPATFRRALRDLARLLFVEATAELKKRLRTRLRVSQTPLADCPGQKIDQCLGLVPILRAGLGMAEAILELVPFAQVWHLGLYRDHETTQPISPPTASSPHALHLDLAYLVDPMLATGGSAIAALDILKKSGVPRAVFIALIAAPEGVRALQEAHPDVPIFLGGLDSHLNEHKYIVPGLGDAGDRQFATNG